MAATMRTDIGKKRKQNEDAAWFDEKRGVFVVADGMGGHLAGEVASGMAIDAVRKMAARHKKPSIDQIKKTVLGAHERIYQRAQGNAECAGMGTTLSMLCRGAGYIYIAHVGDSRIYRLRGGRMEQLTQDHSLVGERRKPERTPGATSSRARSARRGTTPPICWRRICSPVTAFCSAPTA